MARNEEKAQSMLNRFLAGKKEEAAKPVRKRPYLASHCKDLISADRWRQQIIKEIGKKVMEIQNAGLGEHKLRDLNDEINKLIREKSHWEKRIVELNGPDYAKVLELKKKNLLLKYASEAVQKSQAETEMLLNKS